MANRLPKQARAKVIKLVYEKADEYAYMECDRVKNGQFMDMLVEDPDVGGLLRQYMPKERVRTYIKDTILNRYTKEATSRTLSSKTPEQIIKEEYGESSSVIQKVKESAYDCHVLRSEAGNIFIVSEGTLLKWETALRKGLEIIEAAYLFEAGDIEVVVHPECVIHSMVRTRDGAVMAQMFLLVQSGYKVRIAKSQGKMVLMVPFKDKIYSYSYVPMQDGWYYILNKNLTASSFSVFNLAYPKEQMASVQLCRQPRLKNNPDTRRILQSRDYPGMKIEVKPNLNLVDFYNHYPVTDSWQSYVQASLSEEVKNQIYPLFNEKIDGKSKKEAAEMLLNFVQTAFEYMTDQEQFGYERPLFADEMFYYPYADCEDRAILLSVLIRDLLDLDVILLNYPAHIATAVKFDAPVAGNYFTVDGDNYVVCDPTYIGASVGDCMPRYVGASADVIKID